MPIRQFFRQKMRFLENSFLLLFSFAIFSGQFGNVSAQTEIEAKITKGGVKYVEALDMAVIDFTPQESGYAKRITQVIRDDLDYSLYFRVAKIDSFVLAILGNDLFNVDGWYQLGVQYLLEGSVHIDGEKLKVEINLADVLRKKVIKTSRWETKVEAYRALAHTISDEVVLTFTGQKGIFSTKIAYVRREGENKEIYVCDYDGHNPHPVTNDRSINVSPVWSPDGNKLVYTSYKRSNPDLWMVDLSTNHSSLFASYPGLNSAPAWSPDGKYVAATLTRDGNPEIYLLTPQGQVVRRLTYGRAIDSSPTWSPNGKEIAFTSDRSGFPQIYIMDTEGTNLRRLTYTVDVSDSPCWSPRGDRIAFVLRDAGKLNIYTIDMTGENLRQLTHQGFNENPRWSPDGLHIVFGSNRSGRFEVYTMHWDGSGQRRITGEGENYNPSWSPRF
ncbi:MAG: Tol-Pal system beta propeller repeat protein TolB [candidate division Zixibacteria bacterium]|nr:Tol-Pal system beta propeller repeat protein TolB [candidate division Zixibacteria bacterium]